MMKVIGSMAALVLALGFHQFAFSQANDDSLDAAVLVIALLKSRFKPVVVDESVQYQNIPLRFGYPPSPPWLPNAPPSTVKPPCRPGLYSC